MIELINVRKKYYRQVSRQGDSQTAVYGPFSD